MRQAEFPPFNRLPDYHPLELYTVALRSSKLNRSGSKANPFGASPAGRMKNCRNSARGARRSGGGNATGSTLRQATAARSGDASDAAHPASSLFEVHDLVGVDANHDVINRPVNSAEPVPDTGGNDDDIAGPHMAAFPFLN